MHNSRLKAYFYMFECKCQMLDSRQLGRTATRCLVVPQPTGTVSHDCDLGHLVPINDILQESVFLPELI